MTAMTRFEPDPTVSIASRAARAAGCAFVSLAVWMGIAYAVIQLRGCEGGMECLGDALGIIFLGLIGAAVTMWPLLRLVRVRPAWVVALAGPAVVVLLALGLLRRLFLGAPQLWVVGMMVAYALAAVLADPRVPGRVRVLTAGALVLLVGAEIVI